MNKFDQISDEQMARIRKLYPTFTDEQLVEAHHNLHRYVEVLIGMAERLHAEGKSIMDIVPYGPEPPAFLETPPQGPPEDNWIR